MLLSTQTDWLARSFGHEKAVSILANAGFDAYDISLFELTRDESSVFNQADYIDFTEHLRKKADEAGIVCNQAHAPFPSSVGEPEKDQWIFDKIVRSMEIASILGAKIIIVHPKQHLPYARNKQELFELNMEFYRNLIPYCEKFNIKIAVENMWQKDPHSNRKIVHSTCSRPEEFCKYLDELNSPWIVGCLDVGHVPLVGEDMAQMIRMLGRRRLQALHVHDNDSLRDAHTLPYLANQDIDEIFAFLNEIGYEGDLTFEADKFYNHLPKELAETGARFMQDVGRHIMRQIGK